MTDSETLSPGQLTHDETGFMIVVTDSASDTQRRHTLSQTSFFTRALGRAELMMLPFSAAAALAAPAAGAEYRETYIRSKTSSAVIRRAEWDDDAWFFTQEPAAIAEIEALNSLLALPTREGFLLEYDDNE